MERQTCTHALAAIGCNQQCDQRCDQNMGHPASQQTIYPRTPSPHAAEWPISGKAWPCAENRCGSKPAAGHAAATAVPTHPRKTQTQHVQAARPWTHRRRRMQHARSDQRSLGRSAAAALSSRTTRPPRRGVHGPRSRTSGPAPLDVCCACPRRPPTPCNGRKLARQVRVCSPAARQPRPHNPRSHHIPQSGADLQCVLLRCVLPAAAAVSTRVGITTGSASRANGASAAAGAFHHARTVGAVGRGLHEEEARDVAQADDAFDPGGLRVHDDHAPHAGHAEPLQHDA